MNIAQLNFFNNRHNNIINASNKLHTTCPSFAPSASLVKVSANNLKANYLPSFKGSMKGEKSDNSGIGTLNHQTAFFREPKTDETVQNYIMKQFKNDDEINIVSGACSTGEEAKSYAMMLDNLKGKLNIYGFDISSDMIEETQNNSCQLIEQEDAGSQLSFILLDSENMLMNDNTEGLTDYQKKCRDKFREYYTPKGPKYPVPMFPDAGQGIKDLEALLDNKEEFEKTKKEYNEQMQAIKNALPGLAEYMEDVSFEDMFEMQINGLKQRAKEYKTVRDFEADKHSFDNCTFEQGDVLNLQKLYEPNSVNVLLYRNALYHTLCMGDNMFRCMREDAEDTMNSIAKQMNKVVKDKGLVVFGEDEIMQGVDTNIVKAAMENNGFKPLREDENGYFTNIWVKVKDIES